MGPFLTNKLEYSTSNVSEIYPKQWNYIHTHTHTHTLIHFRRKSG